MLSWGDPNFLYSLTLKRSKNYIYILFFSLVNKFKFGSSYLFQIFDASGLWTFAVVMITMTVLVLGY